MNAGTSSPTGNIEHDMLHDNYRGIRDSRISALVKLIDGEIVESEGGVECISDHAVEKLIEFINQP